MPMPKDMPVGLVVVVVVVVGFRCHYDCEGGAVEWAGPLQLTSEKQASVEHFQPTVCGSNELPRT